MFADIENFGGGKKKPQNNNKRSLKSPNKQRASSPKY